MRLSSSAFSDGEAIPRRFTCDGDDVSPPLAWTDVPAGARSLALLCDDPTLRPALGTTGRSTIFQPIEPASPKAPATPKRGSSRRSMTFGDPGYNGPCPPRRHGPHHYHFRLLALSAASLAVGGEPTCRDVEREARKHVLSEATLVGVYQR